MAWSAVLVWIDASSGPRRGDRRAGVIDGGQDSRFRPRCLNARSTEEALSARPNMGYSGAGAGAGPVLDLVASPRGSGGLVRGSTSAAALTCRKPRPLSRSYVRHSELVLIAPRHTEAVSLEESRLSLCEGSAGAASRR
jgi:hypothetical protein